GMRIDRARNGHASAPAGHRMARAIMADRLSDLGTQPVERVTGIEPALSAWESDRSGPLTALTWATDVPLVTVMHPAAPGLMARQWPADRLPWCRRSRCASGGMSVLNPACRSPAVGGNWCSSSRPTLDVGLVPVSQPP